MEDLLQHIASALPEIRKAAGVTVLISRWDGTALKQQVKAERVEVTMKLVDAFQPTDRQRQRALEIQKQRR